MVEQRDRCIKEADMVKLREDIAKNERETIRNRKEIEKMNVKLDIQHELSKSIAVMAEQMGTINKAVESTNGMVTQLQSDVDNITNQMHDQRFQTLDERYIESQLRLSVWERYKTHIVLMIISAVVTIVLTQIGGM